MSKDLVFKVVLQADTKDYVSNVKQSEDVTKAIVKTIKEEADKLKDASEQAGKEVGKVIPDDLKSKADDAKKSILDVTDGIKAVNNEAKQADSELGRLGGGFKEVGNSAHDSEIDTIRYASNLSKSLSQATNEIKNLGDKSVLSAGDLHAMSNAGEQGLKILNQELRSAQAELVRLQSTDGSLKDIETAKDRVLSLQDSIKQVSTAFNNYKDTATNAMIGVDNAASKTIAEIQKFTSVDLTKIVSEAQNSTRAIQSMGSGAAISTKEVERLGQLGATAINSLERELQQAQNELNELSKTSSHLNLDEFKAAQQKVAALEDALILTKNSMNEFHNAAQQATPIVDNLDQSIDKTNNELRQTDILADKAGNGIQGLQNSFGMLTNILAGLGIGITASELAKTADEFKNLEGRIKIAVGESGNFQSALDGVVRVAIATNSNLTATGDLFATLTRATKDMKTTTNGVTDYKLSQAQLLQLTETINQSIKISGASAQASEAAIVQFAQAIGSSVLRGDELNSILEQAPRLAQALADGLGVPIGKLKELGEAGQLTADVVIKALRQQSEAIAAEYQKLPLTVGASIENLKTSWMVYFGELDKSNGISESVAKAIKYIADNLDQLVSSLTFAAQAFIAYKAIGMAAVFLEKANSVRAASVAIQQETVSLTTNTQAQLTNANAAKANAAAHTSVESSAGGLFPTFTKAASGLSALLSRFGAYGMAAAAVVGAGGLVVDIFEKTGTAIGENVAKLWMKITGNKTLEQSEKELAAEQEASKKKQEELAAAREKAAAKDEMLKNAALGLNEVSKATVAEFDKQVKAGERVSVALDNVAKSFNFDTTTGINNGITALLALETQGKATGEQIRGTLTNLLKGVDLSEFQGKLAAIPVNLEKQIEESNAKIKAKQKELDDWKQANSEMNKKDWDANVAKYRADIEKLQAQSSALQVQYANSVKSAALVQGAILDEAIQRTGLSYEELEGKSTKAFKSALGDVNTVIQGMGELKDRGVDVGRALDASISNAINTATNQKEIDDLKAKINSLRSTLGDKVADGLLQQAEQKLIDIQIEADKTKSGINSVAEAFGRFGIQTKAEASLAAKNYMDAFGAMERSGQATAGQLKQALMKMTDEIYNSGDAAKISWYESKLSAYDLKSSIDDLGKASVKTMNDVGNSARNDASQGFRDLGRVAREEAQSTADVWEAAMKKVDAERKAQAASTAKGMGQAMDDMAAKAKDYENRLAAAGMDAGQAKKAGQDALDKMLFAYSQALKMGSVTDFSTPLLKNMEDTLSYWEGKKSKASSSNAGSKSPSVNVPNIQAPSIESPKVPSGSDISNPKTVTYKIQFMGKEIDLKGDPSQQNMMNDFLNELEQLNRAR
ncbi:tape measure protein [Acinetobacter colistiniresistens]|uniref:tape measure protein n=1 Tax=Acinetobacter colistiniresistens TaxID=280145 RepID=UPI000E5A34E0|nr:tape measure protein [Acinetobacter colistiniresistens]